PLITGLFVVFPVIERIPLELPCGREAVRRTARHGRGTTFPVKLKQFSARPGVSAVQRYINRYISDDLYPFFIGIPFQRFPLKTEYILKKLIKTDLLLQLFSFLRQKRRVPEPKALLPLGPRRLIVLLFQCHIEGII